jgi:F0F1-type ATP synthase membrane subunit b/b'
VEGEIVEQTSGATQGKDTSMTGRSASPDDSEQLKAQIEQTREQLGRTAEQLVAKADVKARAQAKVTDLTQRAKDATGQVRRQAAAQADSARSQLVTGRDQLQSQAPDALKQAASKGIDRARKHRTQLIIAVGVLVAATVVVRIWSRR